MFNKRSSNYKRVNINNYEDGPPEKKLISDGDILIKELSKKQQNTKVNLNEQLLLKSKFYKTTEVVPITSLVSGFSALKDFTSVLEYAQNLEELKASGLSKEEIELLSDFKLGENYVKNKHKNINDSVLNENLQAIEEKLQQFQKTKLNEEQSIQHPKNGISLSEKPNSLETKLLKFALENEHKNKVTLPSALNNIKHIENNFIKDLIKPDIKKIRKKARSLSKQIEEINTTRINEPKRADKIHTLSNATKWDLKQSEPKCKMKEVKTFTCKPQHFYTIKNGEIIQINAPKQEEKKLSIDEIKQIPKFQNYEKGSPSKMLYVKNLSNTVKENDIRSILLSPQIISIKMMSGKMRGQAFIECTDDKVAQTILDKHNGQFLKNKPMIIQFGKQK